MAKNIVTPGDQFADKGTTAWADWQRSRLRHALKDVNFEARQIVQVIRDMCAGEEPAWHLMTRKDGTGFRTFEEFVTTPPIDGLGFADYPKFRGMALSDPHAMSEREFDLLTVDRPCPPGRIVDNDNPRQIVADLDGGKLKRNERLRAVQKASKFVKGLYNSGVLSLELAATLSHDNQKTASAIASIRAIHRNGDDAAYRKAVNAAVREAFARPKPTKLDLAQKAYLALLSEKERQAFRKWLAKQT